MSINQIKLIKVSGFNKKPCMIGKFDANEL